MDKPSDETEMFRMNLTWEDDDEVVVKLEPVDSPVAPRVGREKDLVPNEEWTRDGDICRRSYTNKRRKIPTEVKEITFRIEDPSRMDEQQTSTSIPSLSFVAGNSNLLRRKSVKNVGEPVLSKSSEDYEDLSTKVVAPNRNVKQVAISIERPLRLTSLPKRKMVKNVSEPEMLNLKATEDNVNFARDLTLAGSSSLKALPKESTASIKAIKAGAPARNVKQLAVSTPTSARVIVSPKKTLVKKFGEPVQLAATDYVGLSDDSTIVPGIPTGKVQVIESTPPKEAIKVVAPNRNVKQIAISTCTPTREIVSPKQQAVKSPLTLPIVQNLSVPIPVKAKAIPLAKNSARLIVPSKPAETEPLVMTHLTPQLQNKTPVTLPSGNVLYLTPVPKEVVMRSKSVVHVLPETVKTETAPTPKLPIYLRKIPDPPKRDVRKRAAAVVEAAYTGIFSCNGELTARSKKDDADDANEFLPVPLSVLRGQRKVRSQPAPRKEVVKRETAAEREYECTICDKVFAKRKHLYVHAKTHSGEKRTATKACADCGKLFLDNTQLRIHSRVHTGDTPYSCTECNKRFKHATSLSRHWLLHTKERPFPCTLCSKTYRNKSDLVNHNRVHTDERPFACRSCDKRFNDRCARNTHERIHKAKKYKCNVCLRSFAQSTTLRGHMVTHTEERPFSCVLCDMKFKSKTVLRSHERVHTAGRTFPCEHCGLLFTEKRTLARHEYTHKEKPFPCSFCKRWYFRRERLLTHLETHNTKDRPFKCDECLKCYANEGYLKLHTLKAHATELKLANGYTCKHSRCGQQFPNLTLLTRHLAVHGDIFVLECDVCTKRFVKKQTLQMHLIKVHKFGDYYSCSKCDKTFMRKPDLAKHIVFKCS